MIDDHDSSDYGVVMHDHCSYDDIKCKSVTQLMIARGGFKIKWITIFPLDERPIRTHSLNTDHDDSDDDDRQIYTGDNVNSVATMLINSESESLLTRTQYSQRDDDYATVDPLLDPYSFIPHLTCETFQNILYRRGAQALRN